jgi:hypothetical protein
MRGKHISSKGPGTTKKSGSAHWHNLKIQPIEYIEANNLGFHEGNIVKYISRWRTVEGLTDLEKVRWYVDRLIEIHFPGKK